MNTLDPWNWNKFYGRLDMQSSALVPLFMTVVVLLTAVAQLQDVEIPEESFWGSWERWTCSRPCGIGKVIRSRPCLGSQGSDCTPINALQQSSPDDCRLAICPKDCGERLWGLDCVHTCLNCLDDCDKNTGYCTSCMPGYFNPADGPMNCTTECPPNTYGYECRGSCINKCSKDCLDRKLGTCDVISASSLYLYHQYFLILLIIPALTIFSELIRKTQWRRDQGEEQVEIWNMPIYRKSQDAYIQQAFNVPDVQYEDNFMNVDLQEPVDDRVDERDGSEMEWKPALSTTSRGEWDIERFYYGGRPRYTQQQ